MILNVNYCVDSNVGLSFSEARLNTETGDVSIFQKHEGVSEIYRESIQFEYEGTSYSYDVGFGVSDDSLVFGFKVLSYETTEFYKLIKSSEMKSVLENELSACDQKYPVKKVKL